MGVAVTGTCIHVTVEGKPGTKGSARGFVGRGRARGRVIITNDNPKAKGWQQLVAAKLLAARNARGLFGPWEVVPVEVEMTFLLPRPKSHYYTGKRAGQLRPDAPRWHTTKPDVDKLARSTLDALTGVLVVDDSQVAVANVRKLYANRGAFEGVAISVGVLSTHEARSR